MARLHARKLKRSANNGWILTIILWTIVIVTILFLFWSQNNLLVPDKQVYKVADLPKSFVGYKIAHISDLNNTTVSVVESTAEFDPDIIIVSGGYTDDRGNYQNSIDQIEKLVDIAPVYYVYNDEDTECDSSDFLEDTGAINITNDNIVLGAEEIDVDDFIKKNYGDEIITKAKNKDKQSKEYMKYIEKALEETADAELRIIGLDTYSYENGKYDALDFVNNITDDYKVDYDLAITGNIMIADEVSKSSLNSIFTGGTYGTNYLDAEYTKGAYGLNGTQLFVSGGVGGHKGVTRIFNFPEVQFITLSDGTIENNNPLEKFIGLFFKDVGSIFDNDGGFKEYTYSYNNGQENK